MEDASKARQSIGFYEQSIFCPRRQDNWIIGAGLPPYCSVQTGVVPCDKEHCPKWHLSKQLPLSKFVERGSQGPHKPTGTLRYYICIIRWLVKHRAEKNNRQKWRRMEREIKL